MARGSRRCGKTLSAHERERFLDALRDTGNFALACDRLGRSKSGLYKRRARDPLFAAACEAALLSARLTKPAHPEEGLSEVEGPSRRTAAFRTAPGALVLAPATAARPAQIRRSPAGRLTRAGVAAFLKALAATANVRLAASSVGVAHSSIYYRARTDPAFAKAMREALEIGYDLVEQQILQSAFAAFDCFPSPSGEGAGGGEQASWLDANEPVGDHPPLDFAAPPERPRPGFPPRNGEGDRSRADGNGGGASPASPATLAIHRALWLLKYRRDVRLPEGWRYAPKGYRPNARDRMTDEEAHAELLRRMQALRDQGE